MATIDQAGVLQGMLKENYVGTTYSTVITRSDMLDLFTENSNVHDGPEGKYFLMSDLIGAPEGIGSRLENDFLPTPEVPSFISPKVFLKYHYGFLTTTYQAMKNAVEGPAAFANWAQVSMLPLVRSLTDDLDRQAAGYAAAILCRVDVTIAANVISIDAPWGQASDTKGWVVGLRRGQRIVASPNADGSGLRDGGRSMKILSVDYNANAGGGTITVDYTVAGLLDNDYLFKGDDTSTNIANASGLEKEMMGVEGIVDDGTVLDTLQGISRTTVPEWKSQVIDVSAAPYSNNVTEGLLMKMLTDAETYGMGKPNVMVCSHDVFRNAYNALRQLGGYGAQQSAVNNSAGSKGITTYVGTKQITLRGIVKIIPGRIYALDTSTLHRFVLGQGEWDQTAGGTIWRQVQVGAAIKDAYFAFYRLPMQLAVDDPRKSVKAIKASETAF